MKICTLTGAKLITALYFALAALETSWANPEEAEGDKEVVELASHGEGWLETV
ncbi:MAG: hypothetical protein KAW81_00840 [Dehalococcoidia bacterium]|nr:hypothetical protein [Dehalococcoidia bacterium]